MAKTTHIHSGDNEFWRRFPNCQFENKANNMGPADALGLFGRDWDSLCETWEPLLIRWTPSEENESAIYILVKDPQGQCAEIHGSTSSWYAFEGCWEPEPISTVEMRAALTRGWLRDDPENPLRIHREAAAAAMGIDLAKLDGKPRGGNPWASAKKKKGPQ